VWNLASLTLIWRASDVRFGAHYGLNSDIAPCLKSADFVAEIGIPTARDGWWIF
jgi:hypothetical protein